MFQCCPPCSAPIRRSTKKRRWKYCPTDHHNVGYRDASGMEVINIQIPSNSSNSLQTSLTPSGPIHPNPTPSSFLSNIATKPRLRAINPPHVFIIPAKDPPTLDPLRVVGVAGTALLQFSTSSPPSAPPFMHCASFHLEFDGLFVYTAYAWLTISRSMSWGCNEQETGRE